MKLTAKELRALRLYRDSPDTAWRFVHGKTRHALERKGLLRVGRRRRVTPTGHAALASGIPDIFADLFETRLTKKEA